MKIGAATERRVPRSFRFPWGGGQVIEEASISCSIDGHSWEPTIQLLRHEDGSEEVRLCVYRGKRLMRMPMIIDREQMEALARRVDKGGRLRIYLNILAQ